MKKVGVITCDISTTTNTNIYTRIYPMLKTNSIHP